MREAGADIKATADIMGHTEVELTLNTYTDASEDFKNKIKYVTEDYDKGGISKALRRFGLI